MLGLIREKFGRAAIGGIIGFIAFVFIFFGVFNPKSTRGLHEGAVAGTVNGDSISISEFNRELNRRMEFFKNLGGGNFTPEQLRQMHIQEAVFNELVNRKLLAQAAHKQGMTASDEEVREEIRKMPVFQKDGQFDPALYRKLLEANRYTPAGFEKTVRDDLTMQQWNRFFSARAKVSNEEIRQQFLKSEDKRNIKYVLLTQEAAQKGVAVDPTEVKKLLADASKVNLLKSQFEARKAREFKDKTFDQVKESLAKDMVASGKFDEVKKVMDRVAKQVEGMLQTGKGGDAAVNAALKPYGVTVQSTGLRGKPEEKYLPGMGEAEAVIADAYAEKSPIDPAQGGKAKAYSVAAGQVVALVSETQKPNLAQLDSKKDQIKRELSTRKERDLMNEWIRKLHESAKIDSNTAVIGGGADEGAGG